MHTVQITFRQFSHDRDSWPPQSGGHSGVLQWDYYINSLAQKKKEKGGVVQTYSLSYFIRLQSLQFFL